MRIAELAEEHFWVGTIKFVGVKFEVESRTWIAKLKLNEIYNYDSFSESGDSVEKAVKALKNRIKKIIKRYTEI